MQLKIEEAKFEDKEIIQNLLNQLGYELTLEQLEDRLKIYNNNKNYKCFLAKLEDKIVGLIAISIRELFVLETKKTNIEALVVDKDFRGKKIGEELIKFVEDYSKNEGCYVIELTSGKRREKDGALRFYTRLGYKNEGEKATNYLRKFFN